MVNVDAEDWLYDENENALIDMWQTKPVLCDVTGYGVIIIGFLKLKSLSKSICLWIMCLSAVLNKLYVGLIGFMIYKPLMFCT